MADAKTYTEDEHIAILSDRVTTETASLTAERDQLKILDLVRRMPNRTWKDIQLASLIGKRADVAKAKLLETGKLETVREAFFDGNQRKVTRDVLKAVEQDSGTAADSPPSVPEEDVVKLHRRIAAIGQVRYVVHIHPLVPFQIAIRHHDRRVCSQSHHLNLPTHHHVFAKLPFVAHAGSLRTIAK